MRASQKNCTVQEISKSMYLPVEGIESALSTFEKVGLVKSTESKSYIFSPSSKELENDVAALVMVYHQHRVQIINQIYRTPMQIFSDAFKLRQED